MLHFYLLINADVCQTDVLHLEISYNCYILPGVYYLLQMPLKSFAMTVNGQRLVEGPKLVQPPGDHFYIFFFGYLASVSVIQKTALAYKSRSSVTTFFLNL